MRRRSLFPTPPTLMGHGGRQGTCGDADATPLSLPDNEHVYMDLAQKLYKYCPKEWKKEASKVSGEVLHGELTAVRPPLSPSQVTSRTRECCQGVGGASSQCGAGGWMCKITTLGLSLQVPPCAPAGSASSTLHPWSSGIFFLYFSFLPLSFSRIFEFPFSKF